MPILTKADIISLTRIGANIPDKELDMFIRDAEVFDVIPVLPDEMFEDISDLLPVSSWDNYTSYVTGDIVYFGGKYWKALANNIYSEPEAGNTDWGLHQLLNFWGDYIKPFYCYHTVSRFLVEHGRNVTQFGLTKQVADTFENLDSKERAELKASFDSRANHYSILIRKKLDDVGYTFDGVLYEYDDCDNSKPKPKFKFFQGGHKKEDRDIWFR